MAAAAEATEPLWEIGLGFAGLSMPDYRGSDERTGYLLPFPYFVYNGDRLKVSREGARADLFKSKRVKLDFSAAASMPAKSGSGARAGMPDLDPAFELGPEIRIDLNSDPESTSGGWALVLPVRAVIATDFSHTRSLGAVFAPYLIYDRPNLFSDWYFSASFGPMYAGSRYHDYYYEVAPEFATGARPAYDATAGYSGSRLTFALSKRYKSFWTGAFLRYDTLSNAVFEDSPLVRRDNSLMFGLGVAWVLARSNETVVLE